MQHALRSSSATDPLAAFVECIELEPLKLDTFNKWIN
jgi:hypothetical protein